ncbi:MAG TPA: hypothetical protein VLB86_14500 [Gaiellaceae bacterium]|nr:hypothetical protein [Gaiellaceae bacterium]
MHAALVVLLALSLTLAGAAGGGDDLRVRFEQRPGAVLVTNDAGTWTVRTRCSSSRRVTVGPGYVSRLRTADGTLLVEDLRRHGTLNDPEFGGLGAFGWHHARGVPRHLRFTGRNAWEVSGRSCAARNGGFGVVGAGLVEEPTRDGDAVAFRVDVLFSDAYTYPHPLLWLSYRYRVEPDAVRLHVEVLPLCPRGRCGRTRAVAFVKEPKLVAHVVGGGFTRMATFRRDGTLACIYVGGGGVRGPILDTGQCADGDRALLRFDHGTATSGPDGGCVQQAPCLAVAVQGTLDDWARAAAGAAPAYPRDTPSIDGVVWDCKGGSPASPDVRRWETTGRLDGRGRYVSLGGIFPAWEGGRGGYDCEPLARPFPKAGTRYAVDLSFSLEQDEERRGR